MAISLLAGCPGRALSPVDADVTMIEAAVEAMPTDATDAVDTHVLPACAMDSRAQPYGAGMSAIANDGTTIRVRQIDPMPPIRANYNWVVTLEDSAGHALLDLATMTVTPWMPDHGHGASVHPTVIANGDGSYRVENIDLFMAGIWTVTFRIDARTVASDSGTALDASTTAPSTAVFTLCIGGN